MSTDNSDDESSGVWVGTPPESGPQLNLNAPLATNSKRAAAIHKVDAAIESHEVAIQRLCTDRNALMAINQLPPELLIAILLLCLEWQREVFSNEKMDWFHKLSIQRSWTRVCSSWRAIVLDTPSFWSSISHHQPHDQQLAYLQRSGSLPISVYAHIPYHENKDEQIAFYRSVLTQHVSRCRKLSITARDYEDIQSDFFPNPTELSMPILTFLELSQHETEPVAPVPDAIINIDAPNLLHLQLVNLFVPMTCPLLSHASSLQVLNLSLPNGPALMPLEILEAIKLFTFLQRLTLKGCIAIPVSASSSVQLRIGYPALKEVVMEGHIKGIAALTSLLGLPSSCFVKLAFDHESSVETFAQDLAFLQPTIGQSASHLIIHLGYPGHSWTCVGFRVAMLQLVFRRPSIDDNADLFVSCHHFFYGHLTTLLEIRSNCYDWIVARCLEDLGRASNNEILFTNVHSLRFWGISFGLWTVSEMLAKGKFWSSCRATQISDLRLVACELAGREDPRKMAEQHPTVRVDWGSSAKSRSWY